MWIENKHWKKENVRKLERKIKIIHTALSINEGINEGAFVVIWGAN